MSKRRSWAALPAVALTTLSFLAAGCAAATSGSAGAAGAGPASTSPAGSGTGGGAAGSPSPVPTITATVTPSPGAAACANWPANVPKGRLPVTFTAVQVLRCVTSVKEIPGKGLFLAGTLERSTSTTGIARLDAALRRPSTHVPAGTMCPMIAFVPPQIVLVASDGSMLSPTIPLVGCGAIDSPVLAALNAMPWQVLSVQLLPQRPGATATATTPAGTSAGQNPVDLVPGHAKGSPPVN